MNTKVTHLSSVHPASDTRIFLKECSSLAKYYTVTLIAKAEKKSINNGVNIIPFKTFKNRFLRMFISPLRMFFLALKYKAEIYHIHDPELLITLMLLKIFTRSKLIYDIHEDVVSDLQSKAYLRGILRNSISVIFNKFERKISRLTDYNITATPFIREKFKKLNDRTIDINNYPIQDELVSKHKPHSKSVCYIGSITKVRGISTIIDAMELVDAELILAGNYEPTSYRDELKSKKGWQKVKEVGFVNRNEMKKILSISIAGLVLFEPVPNHINAQPNKLFEYMSSSLAVICSNFPLWYTIVEKNHCGILVDPLNSDEIASAINHLIENPKISKRLGKNGSQAVKEIFNWKSEERKLFLLYKKILGV
ncbi:MAG: glycosyltransferase family 4 protein [Candidatus Cloacimonetes bacterium]|nr:glycosyltransferase family 4 protein [Candidatus Cloacimonadota bacterium]